MYVDFDRFGRYLGAKIGPKSDLGAILGARIGPKFFALRASPPAHFEQPFEHDDLKIMQQAWSFGRSRTSSRGAFRA